MLINSHHLLRKLISLFLGQWAYSCPNDTIPNSIFSFSQVQKWPQQEFFCPNNGVKDQQDVLIDRNSIKKKLCSAT
jgi:hypothetical protein